MNKPERIENETATIMRGIGEAAKAASRRLAIATPEEKNTALKAAAKALRAAVPKILEANAKDVEAAKAANRLASYIDRLELNEKRIEGVAKGMEEIAELPDPVGTVLAEWTRPNGLKFQRVRVPLGTIGIIYESRPNVTADAGALSLKAGNASILRGGSDSHHSSIAIHACLVEGLRAAGLPEAAIQLVPTTDREAVGMMLRGLDGAVDVIVPRGGKSLVERVQTEARVPVFAHLEGICHTYVDKAANMDIAVPLVVNAKMRRTGVCGATECLLIDKNATSDIVTPLVKALLEAGCEVRGDAAIQKTDARVKPVAPDDFGKEFLDAIIAVKLVDGVEGAIDHIARYSSQHTDAIITEDAAAAERFLNEVDSAIVLVNASTQFADGGEFGFGGEIGIATGKMHARGPVGVEQLTSFKYKVRGTGQIRPK
ncbi:MULTISPECIES: glutamate-5-semialdehyde dehydrogenase [unclassified Hyphomicrobium]|uniref:glutamate-5-semialdehyde dehydrogenase n=1 Tax=unclassified Hyphomicrobium TaxID=2619925 RepID=UPI000213F800|nr:MULTISPECIES: glutamate-5-semialdehyde dehydrogenase [unclassified Hyphomicrobium]CCB63348.1 Gamma-glutamyl phosphate reductase (GPR) (Glutamate-5-semialdehyde dehydrogenase) (Glutamyl-gamma-semialdehyde dehydrogenase) (GSA dehydrogenase) [Hyphomicrobium sp. MC1]